MGRPSPIKTNLSEIVSGLIHEIRQKGKPTREAIEQAWEVLVGKEAANHSRPKALTEGVLWIEVENSSWMYTLGLNKLDVLQGLIEWIGAVHIRDLKFRIADV